MICDICVINYENYVVHNRIKYCLTCYNEYIREQRKLKYKNKYKEKAKKKSISLVEIKHGQFTVSFD
jgi:hypothetical protein